MEPVKESAPELVIPESAWPEWGQVRIAIVHGAWHPAMLSVYTERVSAALAAEHGNICVDLVASAGVAEIPLTVKRRLDIGLRYDAVVCLGVLIKGETHHMETTATAASVALQQLQLQYNVPVINGIVPAYTAQDAHDRTVGDKCTAAYLARTALYMGLVK